jgi:phospholipid N-methyltransferase
VLEFGPGTGPFTKPLLAGLPEGARYLGVELHGGFVQRLRQRFPRATFVHGSAADAPRFHAEHDLPPVKAILCGLPFASLPPTVQDKVIAALDTLLGTGAQFRTFQYVHAFALPTAVRFRRRMAEVLGKPTRSRAIIRNVPPAFVLRWDR